MFNLNPYTNHVLLLLVIAILVVAAYVFIILKSGIMVPSSVATIQHVLDSRGYNLKKTEYEKKKYGIAGFFQNLNDLQKTLLIANRPETPAVLLGKMMRNCLGIAIILIALDFVLNYTGIGFIYPLWLPFVVGIIYGLLTYSRVNSAAKKICKNAELQIGDSVLFLSIMTGPQGQSLSEALLRISRTMNNPSLNSILENEHWRKVIGELEPGEGQNSVYKKISEAYQIPGFKKLADINTNIDAGISRQKLYAQSANEIYQNRLFMARDNATKSRTAIIIPMACMLLPLLTMIGVPMLFAIQKGL